MAITAAMVKELRTRTGAGMMECKKALTETGGDIDAAVEALRKKGAAQADKKAGRVAAEGVIVAQLDDTAQRGVLLEVNCETDFVAKDPGFTGFAERVAAVALVQQPADLDGLAELTLPDSNVTVEQARLELVGKIGENIQIRRFELLSAGAGERLDSYSHGARIAVLVAVAGGREDLGRDLAMHIAASRPLCVSAGDVPEDLLNKEREIYRAQAEDSGKPAEIMEKMVEGRIRKFVGQVTLLGQPYVKDPDITVEKLLKSEGAEAGGFLRFEAGEGIEKKQDDFVAEVQAQAKGSDDD